MPEWLLIFSYCAALVFAAVVGGELPQRVAMTHTRTQLAMSLVSGLMLGIAFFHLLPHALEAHNWQLGPGGIMVWVVIGLVVMLLLLRLLHFHHQDYAAEPSGHCNHAHSHHSEEVSAAAVQAPNWQGVLLGLSFHTFIDGIALGSAFLAAPQGNANSVLTFGVFLAILLHKPLDAMSITALMKGAGESASTQRRAIFGFAMICPLGAIAFYGLVGSITGDLDSIVAYALAFSAGAFICIALSDLLPEVHFHSHDRGKLTAVFLLGITVAYATANALPGHNHELSTLTPASTTEHLH